MEFKRTKKTTKKEDGTYLLEWKDENDNTIVSMTLAITGDENETIEQNYRLMKRSNPSLFEEPVEFDPMMLEEMNATV